MGRSVLHDFLFLLEGARRLIVRRPRAPLVVQPLLRLLGLRLRRVSVLLLLRQIAAYARVWCGCWDLTSLRFGIGSGRHSVLSLLFGQLLKPGIHRYPQLIVHLLDIVRGDSDRRAHGTLIFLAALYGGVDHVVIVRLVGSTVDHVAGSECAFRAVRRGQILVARHHEDANFGIERRWHLIPARSRSILTSRGRS